MCEVFQEKYSIVHLIRAFKLRNILQYQKYLSILQREVWIPTCGIKVKE